MAGNNDGSKLAVFIIIAIVVILIIGFVAWWMMSPRTIVIPVSVQKQVVELQELNTQQVSLTREYSIELILGSNGAHYTRGVLLANLDKSIPIVYKNNEAEAKELSARKVALLTDVIRGGDIPTIEQEILEINTKLATLYVRRLPQNLREEKGKQMLAILTRYDNAVIQMSLQYQREDYSESFTSYRAAGEAMRDYTKLTIWTLITCYSKDPTVA